jgi:rhodanese-related sulfurtransferase
MLMKLQKFINKITMALPFLILVPALAACGQKGAPLEINVTQAAEMRTQGAFMLDVREPDEWQEAHIPGATLIPLGELEERLSEVPKDKDIVVYCRSGNRSMSGVEILRQNGFSQASSMAGGIKDWIAHDLQTVSGP